VNVSDIELRIPEVDVSTPVISIVIPTLNESINIAEFISWVNEGIASLPVDGEILIVDSSTDQTAEIALSLGVRVLKVPKRGLGRAYIDATPFIRGKYVVLGDADCTYDFRELRPFYEAFMEGATYVMGSRYKGSIEKGAMPFHHQYLGTPITTWILNRIFKSKFSDIHCGMRAMTLELLKDMDLQSQSWEYASELVIKSVTLNATIIEVPVKFYKDRNGRESHHKREGWLSPFKAAWINLRAMFAYGADAFLIKPGGLLAVLGALLTLAVTLGPVDIGPIVLSVFWQMFGAFIFATGINFFLIGLNIRQQITNPRTQFKFTKELFKYNRAVFTAFLLVVSGVFLMSPLLGTYISAGLILDGTDIWQQHLAITGLSLIVCGATYFVNVLINQSLSQFLNEARNKRESK
jgi:glycosyltransferase involved in cell wall biosynthesis